jgi:hypothetical protein
MLLDFSFLRSLFHYANCYFFDIAYHQNFYIDSFFTSHVLTIDLYWKWNNSLILVEYNTLHFLRHHQSFMMLSKFLLTALLYVKYIIKIKLEEFLVWLEYIDYFLSNLYGIYLLVLITSSLVSTHACFIFRHD